MKRLIAFILCLLLAPSAGIAGIQSWEQHELNGFHYSVPTGWALKPLDATGAQEHYATGVDDLQGGVLHVNIQDVSEILSGLSKQRQYTIMERAFEDAAAGDQIVDAPKESL